MGQKVEKMQEKDEEVPWDGTVASGRMDNQIEQPIRGLGQRERPLRATGGGDKERQPVTGATVDRQTFERSSDSKACSQTMEEEQACGHTVDWGVSCEPSNEEGFVVLETPDGDKIESSVKNRAEEAMTQPFRNCLQERVELTDSRCPHANGDLQNALEEADPLMGTRKESNCGHPTSLIHSETRVTAPPDSEVYAPETQENRFASAVSKRAKAVARSLGTTITLKDQRSCPKPQLEQDDCVDCSEDCDGKSHFAHLTKENNLVCFSAVITPSPLAHLLPERDTSSGQMDKPPPTERPKVKGPPPPVPKKPKNPFIKLKATQEMSSDVQRRGNLRSEDKVRRRHTVEFNRCNLRDAPMFNQDMCALWDERGTYANMHRLSMDLSPWEHLSLEHMDDEYGDLIDFEYCTRVAKLSSDEELVELDMLHRRVFLEKQNKLKRAPLPVVKKQTNPFIPAESVDAPEVASDNDTQQPKPALRREPFTQDNNRLRAGPRTGTDTDDPTEIASYKPVAELVRETMKRSQANRLKPEGTKTQVQVAEHQSPSVKVSQMKNTFDVPKKSKERPQEHQQSPKKGIYL
ncbi:uncharacterized protein LOC129170329 [Dunckerocampus dactyliophorus]|uniref:uncharacterized protein LOC129170329 n=1 Tax=Dunckerocampus dactyliophorus TaxID=161453 RepID=UPI0024066457|nr:uncharacterized protein LOC129170329 [Dunckerocampus dactyliophorus]